MSQSSEFASSLIQAGAAGYSAAAAERLVDSHPETAERFGSGAFGAWKEHLAHRLRELAAALVAGEPGLFTSEVIWSRVAFEDRDVPLEDLRASLECLKAVLAEELPPAAVEEPGRYIDLALEALAAESAGPRSQIAADTPEGRLALAYLEATLSGDRRRAVSAILSAVDGGLPVTSAYEALMSAQREVGEMWHAGDVVVAQEHFTTATTQSLMTLLADRAGAEAEPNGKTVMVASAPGDGHYLAARLLANLFEHEGWRTIHLAGGVPPAELARGVDAFQVDLLVISLTVTTRLQATIDAVKQTRAQRPDLKVLVGGRVLGKSPSVCERIGADAYAEVPEEALSLGARLVGLS